MNDDYLARLDRVAAGRGEVFRLPGRRVYVTGPQLAKDILRNDQGLYREHSDFFYTRSHIFGPRSAQIEIGRSSRVFLHDYLADRAAELPAIVDQAVSSGSTWPDAANWLLHRHLASALLARGPSAERELVEQIDGRGVLAGGPRRHNQLSRAVFRRRVMRALVAEVERRQRTDIESPADLLDVIVRHARADQSPGSQAEVFLSFVFATVGATGFLLAWSVYLLGTRRDGLVDCPLAWVVREALRLWPVAWMFGRRPTRAHQLDGLSVRQNDEVVVCAYLVHRDRRQWTVAEEFRPERWADTPAPDAYLPFGWGPHSCAGAAVAMRLVEDVLALLTAGHRLVVTSHGDRPQIGASLAPPRFTLERQHHHPTDPRGGDE